MHLAVFVFGVVLGALDALDAEGAFFHHALGAGGDVGVKLQVERLRPLGLIEVEAPHGVGAVVGAVAGADAAVVNLDVKTLIIVVGSEYRAHGLAWRVLTVLAHYGNVPGLDVGELAFPIPLYADPLVGPLLQEQVFLFGP